MGKKRVAEKSKEEILQEREQIEQAIKDKQKKGFSSLRKKKGKVFISASYNNTILTLTDSEGNTLSWVSAGSLGFKGTKKSTPFAASRVATLMGNKMEKMGIEEIEVFVKGVGSGRNSALRSLTGRDIKIVSIKDITPIPHNGCRPPKPRRV